MSEIKLPIWSELLFSFSPSLRRREHQLSEVARGQPLHFTAHTIHFAREHAKIDWRFTTGLSIHGNCLVFVQGAGIIGCNINELICWFLFLARIRGLQVSWWGCNNGISACMEVGNPKLAEIICASVS